MGWTKQDYRSAGIGLFFLGIALMGVGYEVFVGNLSASIVAGINGVELGLMGFIAIVGGLYLLAAKA